MLQGDGDDNEKSPWYIGLLTLIGLDSLFRSFL